MYHAKLVGLAHSRLPDEQMQLIVLMDTGGQKWIWSFVSSVVGPDCSLELPIKRRNSTVTLMDFMAYYYYVWPDNLLQSW